MSGCRRFDFAGFALGCRGYFEQLVVLSEGITIDLEVAIDGSINCPAWPAVISSAVVPILRCGRILLE